MSTPFSFISARRAASRAVVLTVSMSWTDGDAAALVVWNPRLVRKTATVEAGRLDRDRRGWGGRGRGRGTEVAARKRGDAAEDGLENGRENTREESVVNVTAELCRAQICRMGYPEMVGPKPCRPRVERRNGTGRGSRRSGVPATVRVLEVDASGRPYWRSSLTQRCVSVEATLRGPVGRSAAQQHPTSRPRRQQLGLPVAPPSPAKWASIVPRQANRAAFLDRDGRHRLRRAC